MAETFLAKKKPFLNFINETHIFQPKYPKLLVSVQYINSHLRLILDNFKMIFTIFSTAVPFHSNIP